MPIINCVHGARGTLWSSMSCDKSRYEINGLHCSEIFFSFHPLADVEPQFRFVRSSLLRFYTLSMRPTNVLISKRGGQLLICQRKREYMCVCACADEQKQNVSPYNIKHLTLRPLLVGKCSSSQRRSWRQRKPR